MFLAMSRFVEPSSISRWYRYNLLVEDETRVQGVRVGGGGMHGRGGHKLLGFMLIH